ncbi:MAG: right-handed parallel beta-helix repeat-containing protein [Bacteroidota bacterium]
MKRIIHYILLFFFFLTNTCLTYSQVNYIGGFISSDTTWNSDTVKVIDGIFINENVTLSIEPGTYIEFQNFFGITVHGRLIAKGNINDSITFSIKDTTGYSNGSINNGGWSGISFDGNNITNDTSIFSFCKMQYNKRQNALNIVDFDKVLFENSIIKSPYNCDVCILLINSSPAIKNNTFYNGGMYCESSSPIIYNNFFLGSGIQCCNYSNPIISKNSIRFNQNVSIQVWMESNPIISENIISDNNIIGISCSGSSPIILKNIISNNIARGGAGISCYKSSPLILLNKISNNYSNHTGCDVADGGGGIFVNLSSPSIINNIISNNYSIWQGGGIYCFDTCHSIIANNTIVNNSAQSGGGIFIGYHSTPKITNTIFWGNSATEKGCQVYIENLDSSNMILSYCNVDTIEKGPITSVTSTNNIKTNPEFVNPSIGAGISFDGLAADWDLMETSPCINAGNPDTNGLQLYIYDIEENNRLIEDTIDIGAFEFNIRNSINNIAYNDDILIYPNPTDGQLKIKLLNLVKEDFQLKIYDISGNVLLSKDISNNTEDIDLRNYSTNQFILCIYNKNKLVMTKKIIKL